MWRNIMVSEGTYDEEVVRGQVHQILVASFSKDCYALDDYERKMDELTDKIVRIICDQSKVN